MVGSQKLAVCLWHAAHVWDVYVRISDKPKNTNVHNTTDIGTRLRTRGRTVVHVFSTTRNV